MALAPAQYMAGGSSSSRRAVRSVKRSAASKEALHRIPGSTPVGNRDISCSNPSEIRSNIAGILSARLIDHDAQERKTEEHGGTKSAVAVLSARFVMRSFLWQYPGMQNRILAAWDREAIGCPFAQFFEAFTTEVVCPLSDIPLVVQAIAESANAVADGYFAFPKLVKAPSEPAAFHNIVKLRCGSLVRRAHAGAVLRFVPNDSQIELVLPLFFPKFVTIRSHRGIAVKLGSIPDPKVIPGCPAEKHGVRVGGIKLHTDTGIGVCLIVIVFCHSSGVLHNVIAGLPGTCA